MHIGEKIQQIRKLRRLSLNALAEKVGSNRGNLFRIEKDGKGFSQVTLEKIATALDVSTSILNDPNPFSEVGGVIVKAAMSPIREEFEDDDFDPITEVKLPVYDVRVSGGSGSPMPEYIETAESLTFKRSWLKRKRAKAADVKIMSVLGSSMEPTLFEGDKVAIHTIETQVVSGKVYALAYNNEARIKRLYLLADGRLRISSDNPDKNRYPDEFIDGEELNRIYILGRAINRTGDGGL
jgi:phage repressor protein C with HTH and peptisase S24 domain